MIISNKSIIMIIMCKLSFNEASNGVSSHDRINQEPT